jgi:amidase
MGPLARSAADLDLALSIIAEPVVGEDVAWRLMFPPVRHTALADFRVAVLPPVPWLPVDGEILTALDDLAARLRRLGAWVEEVQPEGFDLWQHHEAYAMLLSVIAFAHLDGEERAHVVEVLHQSSDPFANAQLVGVNATVSQFIGMHGRRERYRALFRAFFRNFDVLLAPVTITPAFPHSSDQVPLLKRTLQVNGTAVPYLYLPVYAGVAAYSGLPACAGYLGHLFRKVGDMCQNDQFSLLHCLHQETPVSRKSLLVCRRKTGRYSDWTWWIIRFPSANPLRAGFL